MKLNIIHNKLRKLGAKHFRNTSGRDVFVFKSRGRFVFIHIIHGAELDSISYEGLVLASQDLVFDARYTWIKSKSGTVERECPVLSGNQAFDSRYSIDTDNDTFVRRILSDDIQTGLLKLEKLVPLVSFTRIRPSFLCRVLDRGIGSESGMYHYDFFLKLHRYPDNMNEMDTFIDTGLALVHAADSPARCARFEANEDFDIEQVRKRWPNRFRDKLSEPVQVLLIAIILGALVYLLHRLLD